jgi:hypothetical protein
MRAQETGRYPSMEFILGILSFFFLAVIFIGALFGVIWLFSDLFRDPALSGWLKALWLLFLIFAPLLGLVVYLIVRGRGIGHRHAARHAADTQAPPAYYPDGEIPPDDEHHSLDQGANEDRDIGKVRNFGI